VLLSENKYDNDSYSAVLCRWIMSFFLAFCCTCYDL